jgi:hypothetical protein
MIVDQFNVIDEALLKCMELFNCHCQGVAHSRKRIRERNFLRRILP